MPVPRCHTFVSLLVVVLLAGNLAGCLGGGGPVLGSNEKDGTSPGDEPEYRATASTPPSNVTVEQCVGYSVQVPLPWDTVAQALPEGFEPAPFVPVTVGPATPTEGRAAEGFFDGWRCQTATAGSGSLGEVTFLFAKIEVRPPSELAPPEEWSSYVPLFLSTDEPRLAEAFTEWGLAASTADPTIETLGSGPVRAGHVQGTAGNTTLDSRVEVGQPPAASSISQEKTRYFLTEPLPFDGETPAVSGIVDRTTRNTTIGYGEGHVQLEGGAVGEALGPALAGIGFDTQDGSWGETFEYRTLEEIR